MKGMSRKQRKTRGRSARFRPNPKKHQKKQAITGHPLKRLVATVDKTKRGSAFLVFSTPGIEDVFLPVHQAQAYFPNDRVEVRLDRTGEVVSIKVLSHRYRELVGRFLPGSKRGTQDGDWLVYEKKKLYEEIYLPRRSSRAFAVKPGDWIRIQLSFHDHGKHHVTGEIQEVYGEILPAKADVPMIAGEFNLIEEHSDAAKAQAQTYRLDIPGSDEQGRKDLRHIPLITIDGETARDFDDAVYVEKKTSGFILWVAIADVSHYVKQTSPLDQEARFRGTSVYFPERAFHMLPRELSENLCSLRPMEPRLAMTAEIHYDLTGTKNAVKIHESIIQSRRRATYNEIESEYRAHHQDSKWEFGPHFELYELLRKNKKNRGALDFEFPEAEIRVDPQGEPTEIVVRPRLNAHRLIEEFMIAANESVTEWMLARAWPFVYRIHETPKPDSIEKFIELASTFGVNFSSKKTTDPKKKKHERIKINDLEISPKKLSSMLERLKGHHAERVLHFGLLRSLKQARYSPVHDIHFGLASDAYTHFTSPIRRYPDLVVHRLIRHALKLEHQKKSLSEEERKNYERELEEITEHCSYRERLATDAERSAIKLKQVRIMLRHLGEDFEGRVTGLTEKGIFVELLHPYAEGFISRDSLPDDFYVYDEKKMLFFGKRKRRIFKMGDPLQVRCVRADVEYRLIDFVLTEFAKLDT